MSQGQIASPPLLELGELSVQFGPARRRVTAVDRVSLQARRGRMLAIVGESGCGKSTLARAIMGLHAENPGAHTSGSIRLGGRELGGLSAREWRKLRGDDLGMIFQDPMTALNPVYTVGAQVAEGPRLHHAMSRAEAMEKAVQALDDVGIPSPRERASSYPHEFSGGMRQRAVIAMALVGQPELLIADEPTTALDVTIQAQILRLLLDLRDQRDCAVVMITHDLAVVAQTCDDVAVMYAGRIVEQGDVYSVFENPTHPYTRGLLNSIPGLAKRDRLEPIPGQPPDLASLGAGCHFAPRCPLATDRCRVEQPVLKGPDDHRAACWNSEVPDGD